MPLVMAPATFPRLCGLARPLPRRAVRVGPRASDAPHLGPRGREQAPG